MLTRLSRAYPWLAIGAIAAAFYWVGHWQGAAQAAESAAVQDARMILHLKAPYLKRLAQLGRIEQQHLMSAQSWRQQADSLRALAPPSDTIVVSDSIPVVTWRAVADAEHQAASECFVSLTACQERAAVAERRAAALDSSLAGLLRVKDCKILFVRCPSRTAVGLVSLGLGFIGGMVVAK